LRKYEVHFFSKSLKSQICPACKLNFAEFALFALKFSIWAKFSLAKAFYRLNLTHSARLNQARAQKKLNFSSKAAFKSQKFTQNSAQIQTKRAKSTIKREFKANLA